jgi:hypothetical protein
MFPFAALTRPFKRSTSGVLPADREWPRRLALGEWLPNAGAPATPPFDDVLVRQAAELAQ